MLLPAWHLPHRKQSTCFLFVWHSYCVGQGEMHTTPTSPHTPDLYTLPPLTHTIFKKLRYLWLKPGSNISAVVYSSSLPTPLSTPHPSGSKPDTCGIGIRWGMQLVDDRKESVSTVAHILFFPPLKGPGYNEIQCLKRFGVQKKICPQRCATISEEGNQERGQHLKCKF